MKNNYTSEYSKPLEVHFCCLYQTRKQNQTILTNLVNKCLMLNHRMLYISSSKKETFFVKCLTDANLNPKKLISDGKLKLLPMGAQNVFEGKFNTDDIIKLLENEIIDSKNDGFSGLTAVGDNKFTNAYKVSAQDILNHESKLTKFAKQYNDCLIYCLYDFKSLSPKVALDLLITHPTIHIGNIEYKNNLYVHSNKSLKDNRDKIILKLLIDNVKERTRVDESYFLESIVENIPNMIFIKDAENLRFVKINKAGEKLTGYKRKELIGKNDYDFFPKKEADFFTRNDREVLASKELLDIPEESIHTRRLGTRYLHTKKIPLLNEKGVPEYLLGISEDITDKKIAEEELNLKDSIIEEIHHRVKNNLQVISSFLYLQTDHFSDQHTMKVLTECQNRISAIALIYDHLCRVENVSDIDMGKYIRELSQTFSITQKSQNQIIQISQSVENVFLEIDKALPCGLILNELLTNSLEHAFSNKKAGEIYIELKQDGKKYSLDVTDNGNGLPKNFNLKRSKSLGLQIVQRLVKQLKGKISVTEDKGTKFNIKFK